MHVPQWQEVIIVDTKYVQYEHMENCYSWSDLYYMCLLHSYAHTKFDLIKDWFSMYINKGN